MKRESAVPNVIQHSDAKAGTAALRRVPIVDPQPHAPCRLPFQTNDSVTNVTETAIVDRGRQSVDITVKWHLEKTGQPMRAKLRQRRAGCEVRKGARGAAKKGLEQSSGQREPQETDQPMQMVMVVEVGWSVEHWRMGWRAVEHGRGKPAVNDEDVRKQVAQQEEGWNSTKVYSKGATWDGTVQSGKNCRSGDATSTTMGSTGSKS